MGRGGDTNKGWSSEDAARCATACEVSDDVPQPAPPAKSLRLKFLEGVVEGFGLAFGFIVAMLAFVALVRS